MCDPSQPGEPTCPADAMAMAQRGLAWLASADLASLPAGTQADCLRGLERAESMHTAARASVLHAFTAQAGYQEDGQGSAKTWLRWQTQITIGAAAGAMAWMRRLAAHPAVRTALAAGAISASFARSIIGWTELLPESMRADADAILLAAAAAGAELSDLASLAEEMRRRTARPDSHHDGFDDRSVQLDLTFGGAGRLDGDLTPQCAAALGAVLDALGKKAGPEDVRSKRQRRHDALEEACRRLISAGCLPDRAGQPTQIHLHMTLDQLRGQDGADDAEAAWAAGVGEPWPAAGPGDDCDASIVPVVTGHVDRDLLDRLVAALTAGKAYATARPGSTPRNPGAPDHAEGPRAAARRERAHSAARRLLLRWAADVLSGPHGLASYLRTGLPEGLVASVSLPLDIGAVTDTIPIHLRRAVATRDKRCRFPGCRQPVAACQPHHIVPRAKSGPTELTNLLSLCTFHHLIAIHRWGWGIRLDPDGSVTATSPDGKRNLTSHGPPATAA